VHFYWARYLLAEAMAAVDAGAPGDAPPERRPVTSAPSRTAAAASEHYGVAAGDACVLPDGRRGHLAEVMDGGNPVLACQSG
jgi:hypothetical protein